MIRGLTWSLLLALAFGLGSAQAADKKTQRLFDSKCSACHGKDGKAQTEKGKKMAMRDMATPEFQKGTDDDFKKAILDGSKKDRDGVKQEMDPFKDELKGPEVDALIALVREFKK